MLIKPSTIIFCCLLTVCQSSFAQLAKKPALHINAAAGFALDYGEPLAALGGQLKLLWPVGQKNNAFIGTFGVDRLFDEIGTDGYHITFILSSIGYRQSFKSAFVEGKAGFGASIETGGNEAYCGLIGIEPGIQIKKISFSLDYRFFTSNGVFDGDHLHLLAFRVGYKIIGSK